MDESALTAPYLHSGDSTRLRMTDAAIALLPAAAGGIWFFQGPAALLLLLSLAGAALAEFACGRLLHRSSLQDGSWMVTGLLLALMLPASAPWWAAPLGSGAAIAFKNLSGGLGHNSLNPAAFGRGLLLLHPALRPAAMRTAEGSFLMAYTGGSLGEASTLLLLCGVAYLALRRLLPWRITGPALLTAFFTGLCIPRCDPAAVLAWGGTLLGAAFLAADPVTSPMGGNMQLAYGAGYGILGTLAAYYGWGIGGICCGILASNLLFRLAELAARVVAARRG